MSGPQDLGHSHQIELTQWDPDLGLNPGLAHLAGQLPATVGAVISHPRPPGDDVCRWYEDLADGDPYKSMCTGSVTFHGAMEEHFGDKDLPRHTVESWDPLTLSPSLSCHCGDHGHIREGRWVPA